jgi:hypothetical protein
MKGFLVLLALLAALNSLTVAVACDQPPEFKITTKRKDDAVDVRPEKNRTVFSVKSPFGIGQAVVERKDEKWPEAVVLRLHLKGLENFNVTNGKVKLEASASLQDGKPLVRLWKDGKEDMPLDSKSPYWIDVGILSGDGTPAKAIPLKDGYFELPLPKTFFEANPKSITVSWIDFYRN